MAVVKRIPLGEKGEKVVVEQAVTVSGGKGKRPTEGKNLFSDISVSDHGSNIHLATQFGSCDFLMPRSFLLLTNLTKLIFLLQEKYQKHKAAIPVPNLKARVHSFGYQVPH